MDDARTSLARPSSPGTRSPYLPRRVHRVVDAPPPTSQLLSPKPAVDQHRKLHLPDHRQKLVAWACRGDIGPDQASRQEERPMNQVGSAARSCTEAHRGAGVPRRAGDP
jgi:hypothetical protein